MKKNRITILIVLSLLAIAIYFYITESGSTQKKELVDFAVEDTSIITKIFIVDKQNKSVLLEKKEGHWIVNQKYIARKDLTELLLKTISQVKVKAPVNKNAHNNIIKRLAADSRKIEIYSSSKLLKTYYVGEPTADNNGTYMLLENSNKAFITHIPGFAGYLSSRYTTSETEWRDRTVFYYSFKDIRSIKVEHLDSPERSFTAISNGDNTYALKNNQGKMVSDFDTLQLKTYIAQFKKINFESFVTVMSKEKRDSVLKSKPLFIITAIDKNGISKSIKAYKRLNYDQLLDDNGKVYPYDVDRMYAMISDEKEMVIIQYFVFDPLRINIDFFYKQIAAKK